MPGGRLIVEGRGEEGSEFLDMSSPRNTYECLEPAIEVAMHEVGRADPDLRLTTVLEPEDPAVFEEPTEDAAYPDRLGQARHARPQSADAAGQQIHRDAGLTGVEQGVDRGLVDQGVDLDPD